MGIDQGEVMEAVNLTHADQCHFNGGSESDLLILGRRYSRVVCGKVATYDSG